MSKFDISINKKRCEIVSCTPCCGVRNAKLNEEMGEGELSSDLKPISGLHIRDNPMFNIDN